MSDYQKPQYRYNGTCYTSDLAIGDIVQEISYDTHGPDYDSIGPFDGCIVTNIDGERITLCNVCIDGFIPKINPNQHNVPSIIKVYRTIHRLKDISKVWRLFTKIDSN